MITTDLATDIGQARFALSDTTEPALFTDAELTHLLTLGGSVDTAVSLAVGVLQVRYARAYDTTIDGQSFKRSQIAQALEKIAAGRGITVAAAYVTRVDAYSDDVAADDTRAPSVLDGYDLDADHDIPS